VAQERVQPENGSETLELHVRQDMDVNNILLLLVNPCNGNNAVNPLSLSLMLLLEKSEGEDSGLRNSFLLLLHPFSANRQKVQAERKLDRAFSSCPHPPDIRRRERKPMQRDQ
jgi:hypothetical protein